MAEDDPHRDARHGFLLRLSDALRPLSDPEEIVFVAVCLLGEQLGVDRAYYVEVDEREGEARVRRPYLRGDSPPLAGTFRLEDVGWAVPHLRRGATVVIADTQTDDVVPDADRGWMAALRMRAHIGMPLTKGDTLMGALCVTEREPHEWTESDIHLVRETADRIWAALARADTESALRRREKEFRALIAASNDLVFRMGRDWTEMRRLVGHEIVPEPSEATDTWLERFVEPADRPEVMEAVEEAIRKRAPLELEHRYRRLDGGPGWCLSRAIPILDEEGEVTHWIGAATDVTERMEAERVQRESDERQAYLLELSDALRTLADDPEAMQEAAASLLGHRLGASRAYLAAFVWEGDRDVVVVEREHRTEGLPSVVGRHPAEPFDTDMDELRAGRVVAVDDSQADAVPEDQRRVWKALRVRARLGVPLVEDGRLVAGFGVHDEAPRSWTEAEIALVRDTAERTWAAVERARAEAALRELNVTLEERVEERTREVRELAETLSRAEQQERQRFSHLLHDDLQQLLYGIQMKVGLALDRAQRGDVSGAAEQGQRSLALLDQAIARTRQLTIDLNPPILEGEGLAGALQWLCSQMRDLHGLEVELRAEPGLEAPTPDLRMLLFQVARELLLNVTKHAGTDRATIDVGRDGQRLSVIIEDRGRGFDPASLRGSRERRAGLGLISARERLRMWGGGLDVESEPGRGTRVVAHALL